MSRPVISHNKRVRKVAYLEPIITYLIFCEGTKTEPQYFNGFKKAINSNPIYKNTVKIISFGTGTDTVRVMDKAVEYVKKHNITDAKIWCVYDKDNFPSENFNRVPAIATENNNKAENKMRHISYHTAWSNQCIEYWFLLHFAYYDSNNDRSLYSEFLDKKFTEFGYNKYDKNNDEVFEILTTNGNPKKAIERAKKRISCCSGMTESASAPATKVYELVERLAKYLPDEYKEKYI